MMSNTDHDQDTHVQGTQGQGMETLSALFDGELQGDAARFAMKRLGHDPQWRQAVGNWQLLGDVLRGQAASVAPADFAARMVVVVAAESAAAACPDAVAPAVVTNRTPSPRRRWLGGAALAASVAMVAMLVARPFSQDSSTNPGTPMTVPSELATATATAPKPIAAPAEVVPASPDSGLAVGAAAIAVAEVPRRIGERRSRGQGQRAALRASQRQAATPAIASGATALAVSGALHSSVNPFRPQHVEVVSRPWPRAALPGSAAGGALTASFGAGAASSPSFYPFEPRLPANTGEGAAAPLDADERRR